MPSGYPTQYRHPELSDIPNCCTLQLRIAHVGTMRLKAGSA